MTTAPQRSYETAYRQSIDDPESFWAEAAEAIH